ncbi:MAG: hypothetical protein K0U12_07880 [Gammaproteobacteria bacterium]|nr:hypothetical protein [Gammaproteobacteria bacterium]
MSRQTQDQEQKFWGNLINYVGKPNAVRQAKKKYSEIVFSTQKKSGKEFERFLAEFTSRLSNYLYPEAEQLEKRTYEKLAKVTLIPDDPRHTYTRLGFYMLQILAAVINADLKDELSTNSDDELEYAARKRIHYTNRLSRLIMALLRRDPKFFIPADAPEYITARFQVYFNEPDFQKLLSVPPSLDNSGEAWQDVFGSQVAAGHQQAEEFKETEENFITGKHGLIDLLIKGLRAYRMVPPMDPAIKSFWSLGQHCDKPTTLNPSTFLWQTAKSWGKWWLSEPEAVKAVDKILKAVEGSSRYYGTLKLIIEGFSLHERSRVRADINKRKACVKHLIAELKHVHDLFKLLNDNFPFHYGVAMLGNNQLLAKKIIAHRTVVNALLKTIYKVFPSELSRLSSQWQALLAVCQEKYPLKATLFGEGEANQARLTTAAAAILTSTEAQALNPNQVLEGDGLFNTLGEALATGQRAGQYVVDMSASLSHSSASVFHHGSDDMPLLTSEEQGSGLGYGSTGSME